MTTLTLHCLGTLQATVETTTAVLFPTDKIRGLLIYLALNPGPHRREGLAALFWPDLPQALAANNLRVTWHRLRQALDQAHPGTANTLLISTRQTLQIDAHAVQVDAIRMHQLLAACATHPHAQLSTCEACLTRLTQAVDLYRDELLAGFGLDDAPAFEEWLLLQREQLHQQALMALDSLVTAYETQGDDLLAHRYASRQLALDPYREAAHRQLMRILARRGLQSEALAQYERCRRLLGQELGMEPTAETIALAEQIRASGVDAQPAASEPRAPAEQPAQRPTAAWLEAPEIPKVYGRETELAALERWLLYERCRVVALLGIGGVGKTTLAAAMVKAVSHLFEVVIWCSLLNALPPDELFQDLLHRLPAEAPIDLPATQDAQLARLLDCLRQRRCLLVLDNLESILQPHTPGEMRPGYGGYAQLLQLVATQPHQSCLLLTSRERPHGLGRHEEDTPLVRILALEGLDDAAGAALLIDRGLAGRTADAAQLTARYSGNPLALRLVAQTVQELFAGDIATFLAVEAPIFDDIRHVLDQQLERLSPFEKEILLWLAIEREPVTLLTLRANLVEAGSPRALVETLRALHRRSLITQSDEGFLLQNVVTEYLTELLVEQVCQEISTFSVQQSAVRSSNAQSKIAQRPAEILNRHALLKATAKEAVRANQTRLIIQPVVERLLAQWGQAGLVERLRAILSALRSQPMSAPGYAAGNLLNLFLYLGVDLQNYDFSGLHIWQAYLQGYRLPGINFRGADLAHSSFTHVFGDIRAIHFDADGQLLVAALLHGKLCLWRALDGQLLREYQHFGSGAIIASFSSDGALLVSADTDHQVRVWDVAQGRLIHSLSAHRETPWVVRFSGDGQTVASSGAGGIVYVWDVPTGQLRQTLQGHPTAVQGLALTRDGQWLASGHVDGVVCIWRLGEGATPHHILPGHTDVAAALVFDGTGARLISGSYDCTLRIWDVARGETRHILRTHTQKIRWLALSADGYTLASGGHDTFVCLWDVREPAVGQGYLRHTLLGHDYSLYHLAFRADGRTIATVGIDQTIHLWDVVTGQRLERLKVYRSEVQVIDVSTDGRWLASGGDDCLVHVWDVAAALAQGGQQATPVVQRFAGHKRSIYALAFSPQGDLVASAGREPEIQLWRVSDGRSVATLVGHRGDVKMLHFRADGRRLVSASRDGQVCLWEISAASLIQGHPRYPIRTLQGHTDQVLTCSFSPDGALVASGGYDRTICLWDAESGQLLHTLAGHAYGVRSVAFSPDGKTLISSGYDRTLRLWDVATGQLIHLWPPQNSLTLRAIIHPNGELLATGASDHTVRLWDLSPARRGQLRATLRGHTDLVEWICFSPDGQWLASCGTDETIRLWEVATALTTSTGEAPAAATACLTTLRPTGPYAGMNITGVTGISPAQKATLIALGAVD
jgi:WD40 repeat protein/DNA-binding SARP family transcriptional activator